MTALVHVHAALQFLWLFMLIAQVWFVRTKRIRLHRLVGRSSFVIVPVIILSKLITTHAFFNKPPPPGVTFDGLCPLDIVTLGQLVLETADHCQDDSQRRLAKWAAIPALSVK